MSLNKYIFVKPKTYILDNILNICEKFVILIYFSPSNSLSINNKGQELFITMKHPLEHLKPTKGALQQHSLLSFVQAGHIWRYADELKKSPPSENECE